MLAAGDTPDTILKGHDWLQPVDIRGCLLYARRLVGHERIEPALTELGLLIDRRRSNRREQHWTTLENGDLPSAASHDRAKVIAEKPAFSVGQVWPATGASRRAIV